MGDLFYTSKSERELFNVHVKSSPSVYTFKSTVRLKSVSGRGTSTVYAGGEKRQGGNVLPFTYPQSGALNTTTFAEPFFMAAESGISSFLELVGVGTNASHFIASAALFVGPLVMGRPRVSSMSRTNGAYDGVRAASMYLREQGVPRIYRKRILESFEIETISLRTANNSTFGMRFYGGVANQSGRYLFPTFTNYTNRNGLALPYNWNSMSGLKQFQIAPETPYIFGRAASQGGTYSGGSYQMYIHYLINLLE